MTENKNRNRSNRFDIVKKCKTARVCSMILAFLMVCCPCSPVSAATARATTMKLESTTGTVTLKSQNGAARKITKGMRLYNGNTIETAASSYAYISLDSSKAVKLDAGTKASLRQNGRRLELFVKSGKLFFDVKSPLGSSESMNVRTSTMVTGVRGTCGIVEVISSEVSQLHLLEGKVTFTTTNAETGKQETTIVTGGQTATIEKVTKNTEDITVEAMSEEKVPLFAIEEVVKDRRLQEKIENTTSLRVEKMADYMEQQLQGGGSSENGTQNNGSEANRPSDDSTKDDSTKNDGTANGNTQNSSTGNSGTQNQGTSGSGSNANNSGTGSPANTGSNGSTGGSNANTGSTGGGSNANTGSTGGGSNANTGGIGGGSNANTGGTGGTANGSSGSKPSGGSKPSEGSNGTGNNPPQGSSGDNTGNNPPQGSSGDNTGNNPPQGSTGDGTGNNPSEGSTGNGTENNPPQGSTGGGTENNPPAQSGMLTDPEITAGQLKDALAAADSVTIAKGSVLKISKEETVSLEQGKTLTVQQGASVLGDGALTDIKGTVSNEGEISLSNIQINGGTIKNQNLIQVRQDFSGTYTYEGGTDAALCCGQELSEAGMKPLLLAAGERGPEYLYIYSDNLNPNAASKISNTYDSGGATAGMTWRFYKDAVVKAGKEVTLQKFWAEIGINKIVVEGKLTFADYGVLFGSGDVLALVKGQLDFKDRMSGTDGLIQNRNASGYTIKPDGGRIGLGFDWRISACSYDHTIEGISVTDDGINSPVVDITIIKLNLDNFGSHGYIVSEKGGSFCAVYYASAGS